MSHLLRVQLNGLIKELGIAMVVMLDVPQVLYQQRIGAIPVQLASLLSAGLIDREVILLGMKQTVDHRRFGVPTKTYEQINVSAGDRLGGSMNAR